jgi:hypothetical protein
LRFIGENGGGPGARGSRQRRSAKNRP